MDKATVEELHSLFVHRANVQRARESAMEQHFWIGVINDAFKGTGTRGAVLDALGGHYELGVILMQATVAAFEAKQQKIDAEILALGGTP